ncbi:hypothetical protein Glove_212g223 [Diversispora epigaea]|uniref:Protein kinase domain-containing protein n=1 Tax=Diversispora epigaea TaxID=1348612 RepID=A0A397IPR7_9GLOM|nr:hypothetical protein Glove_212g223 [Diversispora epigaea]
MMQLNHSLSKFQANLASNNTSLINYHNQIHILLQEFQINLISTNTFSIHFICRNEYGKCEDCRRDNTGKKWCNTCNSRRFRSEFNKWTSEDSEFDKFIQETQLKATNYEEVIEWIPFDRFNNIKYLDKGGFGKVFRATWSDGYIISWKSLRKFWERSQGTNVCLKSLNTSINKKSTHVSRCMGNCNIGITKNPKENEYMIVMQYARYGSLRKMLNSSFKELTWNDKIENLYYIALGLVRIHETGLMHKDFHSGNIVNITKISSYITDFGLFFTSYPPYYNIPHDEKLVILICDGHKPEIKCEIPQSLKDLMEKCWSTNPSNRPTAKKLESQLLQYFDDNYKHSKKKKMIGLQIEKANKANKLNKNFIQYDPKITHLQAIYTSRHLSFLKPKKVETIIYAEENEIPEN